MWIDNIYWIVNKKKCWNTFQTSGCILIKITHTRFQCKFWKRIVLRNDKLGQLFISRTEKKRTSRKFPFGPQSHDNRRHDSFFFFRCRQTQTSNCYNGTCSREKKLRILNFNEQPLHWVYVYTVLSCGYLFVLSHCIYQSIWAGRHDGRTQRNVQFPLRSFFFHYFFVSLVQ